MRKSSPLFLKHLEFIAYLLAGWSFLVLFFEPVIDYYMNFKLIESLTVVANLGLLLLTIINRFFFTPSEGQKIVVFDVIMLVMGALLLVYSPKYALFLMLIRQTYFLLQFLLVKFADGRLAQWLSGNPPVTLLFSFALAITIGTILLMLPVSSVQNRVTPFVDALFTSTSATCVTGLVVVDTGTHWSTFGQLVILLLIQIGGLGIMTISTFFALLLGQSINLKLKNVMYQMVGGSYSVNIIGLLKNIVVVTLLIESFGAMLLFVTFVRQFSPLKAIYTSVFHSVSAFCNAGFSTLPGNMAGYLSDPVINLTIPLLIILGGIGFTVLIDLHRYIFVKDRIHKLNLHSKIVLITTLILIGLGFVSFFMFEFYTSMKGYSLIQRIMASFFQSVTTRTAGFNTINIGLLSKPAVLVAIALMFVGASPGSTGGGIKTTTFALLSQSIISLIKGRRDMTMFNRKIPLGNFREATGLTMLSALIVVSVLVFLLMLEPHSFEKLAFEAVSAFGTVGLSMGVTEKLSAAGKLLITLLMYVGRVGPLTMIYAFAIRKKRTDINYAEETIAIG